MPKLILHFPENLASKSNFEDILTIINKEIQSPADKFKSRSAWMRSILRQYVVISNNSQEKWKSDQTVIVGRERKNLPELTFWKGSALDALNDNVEGQELLMSEFILNIGELQHKWLQKALVWENTIQIATNEEPRIFRNAAELGQYMILMALLQVQMQVDMGKLKEEEGDLKDDDEEDEE